MVCLLNRISLNTILKELKLIRYAKPPPPPFFQRINVHVSINKKHTIKKIRQCVMNINRRFK